MSNLGLCGGLSFGDFIFEELAPGVYLNDVDFRIILLMVTGIEMHLLETKIEIHI